MKPQDILVLLKVFLWRDREWSQRELAASLALSPAEINHALKRLEAAKLYNPYRKHILRQAAFEFIVYGLKYAFPGKLGAMKVGLPTAHSVLADEISFDPSDIYVWPHRAGSARGQSLEPLYRSAFVASKNDAQLHKLLALIDVLRVGQVRETNIAKKQLSEALLVAHGAHA